MDDFGKLLLCALDHFGMVMSHTGGEDASEKVQIPVALHIPHVQALAVIQRDGLRIVKQVIGPKIFFLFVENVLCVHVSSFFKS
jgi:hypothetical protein